MDAASDPAAGPALDDGLRVLAVDLFARFRAMSFDGVGITRETYGPGETGAMAIVEEAARAEGLAVAWDAARNLIVTLPGRRPDLPVAACGSHLDSVPQGGNFDGAAGVIAGLLTLIHTRRSGARPLRTLALYVVRGEESAWFNRCYLGSGALFGRLTADDLAARHRSSGRTLAEHMEACGVELEPIRARRPLADPNDFACFVELHIEQGPVMVARGWPVAIVTGIRGNLRHPDAECIGEAAHSGTVPRWLRRDAVFATSDLLMRLDEHWRTLLEQGVDLVLTAGIVATDPAEHAISRVPGRLRFALEYRSQDPGTLEAFGGLLRAEADEVGGRRGVRFDFGPSVTAEPALMDPAVVAHFARACERLGIPHSLLPSGAGHDASIFANAGVPTTMIFVRNEHGSHNPHEAMALDDFFLGAEVLRLGLIEVAEAERPFAEEGP
jgi:beta-ureidopropionase / N-carbamoyl-L-amino-acid hydrolase